MQVNRNCNHPTCGPVCRRPPTPQKKKTFIRPLSKKRAKQNRQYLKKRKDYLKEGDICEARLLGCTWFATELHHPSGRSGSRLIEVEKCKKVCRNCHRVVEENPGAAKRLGLSESRLTK